MANVMVVWLLPRSVIRLVALWLIVLAVLPWTTPFPTLDLSVPGSATPALDAAKGKGTHDDVIPAPAMGCAAVTFPITRAFRPEADAEHAGRPCRRAVLRI